MDKFPELERLLQGKKIVILLKLASWQARPGVRQRQRKTVRQRMTRLSCKIQV